MIVETAGLQARLGQSACYEQLRVLAHLFYELMPEVR